MQWAGRALTILARPFYGDVGTQPLEPPTGNIVHTPRILVAE